MKQVISLMLIFSLLLGLVGCSSKTAYSKERAFIEDYLTELKGLDIKNKEALDPIFNLHTQKVREVIQKDFDDVLKFEPEPDFGALSQYLIIRVFQDILGDLTWQYKLQERFTDGTIRMVYDFVIKDYKTILNSPEIENLFNDDSLFSKKDWLKEVDEVIDKLLEAEERVTVIYNFDLKEEDEAYRLQNDTLPALMFAILTKMSYEIDYDVLLSGKKRDFVSGLGYDLDEDEAPEVEPEATEVETTNTDVEEDAELTAEEKIINEVKDAFEVKLEGIKNFDLETILKTLPPDDAEGLKGVLETMPLFKSVFTVAASTLEYEFVAAEVVDETHVNLTYKISMVPLKAFDPYLDSLPPEDPPEVSEEEIRSWMDENIDQSKDYPAEEATVEAEFKDGEWTFDYNQVMKF